MKYAIHPDFKSISRISAFRTRLGISFVRHRYKGLFEYEHDIPGVKVCRLNIPAESSPTGFVRSVLYTPEVLKSNTKVLFCHGGALVLPALPYHYRFARTTASELSGLVCCPECGRPMYGSVNRKRKKDGSFYRDYWYYACKHRLAVDGHKCSYSKQIHQEKLNAAVEEIIKKIVHEPKFEEAIKAKINARIDTDEIDTEIASLKKRLRQLTGAKDRIGRSIDSLYYLDPCYDNKYVDLQKRLDDLYIAINAAETEIAELKEKTDNIRRNKISEEKVYEFLLLFDILYDKMTDAEKKEVLASFIERVDIFPAPKENGQILKSFTFRIPIVFDGDTGNKVYISFPDKEVTVETVCLLYHQKKAFIE